MRVLVLAGFFVPHVGGYIKNIHEVSKRLVLKGNQVTVITCNTESAKRFEILDRVKIIRLPVYSFTNESAPVPKFAAVLKLFKRRNYDIVITQTRFFPLSVIGALYARIYGIPHIHVERGSCHSVSESKFQRMYIKMFDHTIGSFVVKSAKKNIGVSQKACEFVKHIGGKNVSCIHNGIDLIIDRAKTIHDVCFVGRLIYAKGVQDLISAFAVCCKTHDDIRLIIVGDGVYRNELQKLAEGLRVQDRVIFYGTQKYRDAMTIMASSSIFVNPSYSEGLPSSVLEAASVGKPVIATDVGGTNEIISHGETGLLYNPHDIGKLSEHINWCLGNINEARKMGINALKFVNDNYSWDSVLFQYESLLKEIVGVR
jgi:glycosyltransferase involved in cell wall biosynthesis